MIDKIVLNCGPAETSAPLALAGSPGVTLLVGPNNCGKSALLEAIYNGLAVNGVGSRSSALAEIGFPELTDESIETDPRFRGLGDDDPIKISPYSAKKSEWRQNIRSDPLGIFAKAFRADYCIWLNGSERLAMLRQETSPKLLEPEGPLAKLFVDDARRCPIPDVCIDERRLPLFIARATLRELIAGLEARAFGGATR